MAFESNPGANKLANVLSKRIKQEGENPLVLDFGEIQANKSLITNTFPLPIPKGQYSVCRSAIYSESDSKGNAKLRNLAAGDRVLVGWVQNEAVVIDIIISS